MEGAGIRRWIVVIAVVLGGLAARPSPAASQVCGSTPLISCPVDRADIEINSHVCLQQDCDFGKITIKSGGELDIPDQTRALKVKEIIVSGSLQIGTAAMPVGTSSLGNRITITFTGERPCPSPQKCAKFSKGIEVMSGGALGLYGLKGVPPSQVSWSYLGAAAGPPGRYGAGTGVGNPVAANGDTVIQLADDVSSKGWQAGDWIVVATTSFNPFETEFVQIDSFPAPNMIKLVQPLKYYHFGFGGPAPNSCTGGAQTAGCNYGVDERAEVGLITRNIKLTAAIPDDPNSRHWGGDIMYHSGFDEAATRVQGVEIEKFGKDQLGSYPIHFHRDGALSNATALVNANSIHHSFNKCLVVHSTSNVTLKNNVCARIVGHIFYEEWGNETGVVLDSNLGLGAMSNNFNINAPTPGLRKKLVENYWWTGDNLVKQAGYNYNGFNIPDTDGQQNPTRGGCGIAQGDGTLKLQDPKEIETNVGGQPGWKNCPEGQIYFEPASGFWIVNPTTVLTNNSIGGCQGTGRAYWYVPPKINISNPKDPLEKEVDVKFQPEGLFQNNRAHACYSGLYAEGEDGVLSDQLFPHKPASSGVPATADDPPLFSTFDRITATRNRDRGVWLRPDWFVVKNARLATNRDSVSLVSAGGFDGAAPGSWAMLENSVVVGLSQNNVDRFGPCPYPDQAMGLPNTGRITGCIDVTPITFNDGKPVLPNPGYDVVARGYPTPNWNFAGFMIYDGPALIFNDAFVNFNVDIRKYLTGEDRAALDYFTRNNEFTNHLGVYEGDAALGWFQSNQSSYPNAQASEGLTFDHVDLRHQIYTDKVNLGPFNDGDKNTLIVDLDGTLTGFEVVHGGNVKVDNAISLNNLPFNATAVRAQPADEQLTQTSADECLAQGAQDTLAEQRPTSLIEPGSLGTLEFEAETPQTCEAAPNQTPPCDCNLEAGPNPPACTPEQQAALCTCHSNWQHMTFTKDSTDYDALFPQDKPKHWSMVLHGRNFLGVWEPKVMNGYGYTIGASSGKKSGNNATVGIPSTIDLTLADLNMPSISAGNPFYVRVGICYSNKDQTHPSNDFKIVRGYKSFGAGNVSPKDPELQKYWNKLPCDQLDSQHPPNATACPSEGAVVDGACPDGQAPVAGMCPKAQLDDNGITSVADLLDSNTHLPVPNKYFYDKKSGMLLFYMVQSAPNALGPSPLGSCGANAQTPLPPECPHGSETYYTCPAGGCTSYRVKMKGAYDPGRSSCNPYPPNDANHNFTQDPPANQNTLAYVVPSPAPSPAPPFNTGDPVTLTVGGTPEYPHATANPPPVCQVAAGTNTDPGPPWSSGSEYAYYQIGVNTGTLVTINNAVLAQRSPNQFIAPLQIGQTYTLSAMNGAASCSTSFTTTGTPENPSATVGTPDTCRLSPNGRIFGLPPPF